jgi:hypothetical protein
LPPAIAPGAKRFRGLALDDDIERMDDPGQIPEQRQNNIDPEMLSQTFLQKDPERGQQNGDDDPNDIHMNVPARRGASFIVFEAAI